VRRSLALFVLAAFSASAGCVVVTTTVPPDTARGFHLDILYTSDTLGYLEPCG
jgi:hypothetical protein